MIKETKTGGWRFDNSYAKLPETFFSLLPPSRVRSPRLIVLNHTLAASLGLDTEYLQTDESIGVFAGNTLPEGALPLAQAYAGHQFGHFTMLGDGRAILLGEQSTPSGERVDIQLKGAGRTPYSRGGDGRAALGPMLREYMMSEAMHALRIPTTRSLAVVTTGETIFRETELPGAILVRVATSHLRVGTFQYAAKWGSVDELQSLADYALQRHFPAIEMNENRYLTLLEKVIERQAALVAKWQLVGFIHGVMNTDNMTISGETIDYGPCAFMDKYDLETVFSSIDTLGRYSYGNQPKIAGWNLARFAETLLPLIDENQEKAVELAQDAVSTFTSLFQSNWLFGMRAKLGIFNEEKEDEILIDELLKMMEEYGADYTNTFVSLTLNQLEDLPLFSTEAFFNWHKKWQERRKRQQESEASSNELMRTNNPAVIPRNHRIEAAIEAAVERDDYSVMNELLDVLSNPYSYTEEQKEYAKLPPKEFETSYQTFCGT